MVLIGQITTTLSSPAIQVAMVVAGCLVLFMAVKACCFILKVVMGLFVLALLGGSTWWLLSEINH